MTALKSAFDFVDQVILKNFHPLPHRDDPGAHQRATDGPTAHRDVLGHAQSIQNSQNSQNGQNSQNSQTVDPNPPQTDDRDTRSHLYGARRGRGTTRSRPVTRSSKLNDAHREKSPRSCEGTDAAFSSAEQPQPQPLLSPPQFTDRFQSLVDVATQRLIDDPTDPATVTT